MKAHVDRFDQGPLLAKATMRAGSDLGLTVPELRKLLGLEAENRLESLDKKSPSGHRALQLIRIYRSLTSLVGNETDTINHWMHTRNRQFRSSPRETLMSENGLTVVESYLDSLTR